VLSCSLIVLMQVDWLPPIHAHIYATCNCFDHTPHLEKFWNIIRAGFKKVMQHLPVLLTGKGADGDPRERCMTLQLMYSRWREKHHPRLASFSAPLSPSSVWVDFPGSCNPNPNHSVHALTRKCLYVTLHRRSSGISNVN
jgi:hypothetical protein